MNFGGKSTLIGTTVPRMPRLSSLPIPHKLKRLVRAGKTFMASSICDSIVVLNYHRIEKQSSDANNLVVTPQRFAEQMKVLRQHFWPVGLKEVKGRDHIYHTVVKPYQRRRVLVTFDDGYFDTYEKALPILEKYHVPAVVFVTTGMIDQAREFWWDEIEEFFLGTIKIQNIFPLKNLSDEHNRILASYRCRSRLYQEFCDVVKKMAPLQIQGLMNELRALAGVDALARPEHRAMSREELKSLASHPLIEIGAHTVSHPSLGRLSADEQRAEVAQSKHYLEDLLNIKIDSIAYPYGGPLDFSQSTIEVCKDLGFQLGFSTIPGVVHPLSESLALPRFFIKNWSGLEFKKRLEHFLWLS